MVGSCLVNYEDLLERPGSKAHLPPPRRTRPRRYRVEHLDNIWFLSKVSENTLEFVNTGLDLGLQ